jgi:hypothetical protein
LDLLEETVSDPLADPLRDQQSPDATGEFEMPSANVPAGVMRPGQAWASVPVSVLLDRSLDFGTRALYAVAIACATPRAGGMCCAIDTAGLAQLTGKGVKAIQHAIRRMRDIGLVHRQGSRLWLMGVQERCPSFELPEHDLPTASIRKRHYDERRRRKELISHIATRWNALAEECGLPRLTRLTLKREAAIVNRMKEQVFKEWGKLENAIREQPFLHGENDRGWRLTFDALFERQDLATKIVERQYLKTQRSIAPKKLVDKAGVEQPIDLIPTQGELDAVRAGEKTWGDIVKEQMGHTAPF